MNFQAIQKQLRHARAARNLGFGLVVLLGFLNVALVYKVYSQSNQVILIPTSVSDGTASNGADNGSSWQAHYYYYPLISWLGTIVDGLCLETTVFDVAYISEIDPLWNNVELNNLLNPESILFANPSARKTASTTERTNRQPKEPASPA
ncbi:MAG: hypothetical protein GQ535_03475 [Rhodobacteraceae bacterium]|nr:hypothetical protein [Paracoccaceae bacterium]